jgi:hypothetical protein
VEPYIHLLTCRSALHLPAASSTRHFSNLAVSRLSADVILIEVSLVTDLTTLSQVYQLYSVEWYED